MDLIKMLQENVTLEALYYLFAFENIKNREVIE